MIPLSRTVAPALAAVSALLLAAPSADAQDTKKVVDILKGKDQRPKKAAIDGDGGGAVKKPKKVAEKKPAKSPASKTPTAESKKKPASGAVSVTPRYFLRDHGKLAGEADFENLRVETSYGVLVIPIRELVRVRFARRPAAELQKRVEALIAKLGNDDFDTRENAQTALEKIGGPATPQLRAALKSDSEEIRTRAESLLDKLKHEKTATEESPATPHPEEDRLVAVEGKYDEVVTTRMTIRGRVLHDGFSIASRYGTLNVKSSDLIGIVFQTRGPQSVKKSVAASFQPPGNWFDTRLDVAAGQRFHITAGGNISVNNYGVTSGPDGNRQYSGRTFDGFPTLALVGKIGKRGKAFLVGSNHKGRAKSSGRLYLSIVPFLWNPAGAVGSYNVSVQIRPD